MPRGSGNIGNRNRTTNLARLDKLRDFIEDALDGLDGPGVSDAQIGAIADKVSSARATIDYIDAITPGE